MATVKEGHDRLLNSKREEINDIILMAICGTMALQYGGNGFAGANNYVEKMNKMIEKIENNEEPEEEP